MDTLFEIDKYLFEVINQDLSNSFFDIVLVFVRNKVVWIPLYVLLIVYFIFNFKKKGVLIISFAMMSAGIADYTSSSIIKPQVQRLRPCNDANTATITRVDCGVGYSFPSSHATNHFTIGMYFFLVFLGINRFISVAFILWAAIISFAQVYVGVHYPIDVTTGMMIGLFLGTLMFKLEKYFEHKYFST